MMILITTHWKAAKRGRLLFLLYDSRSTQCQQPEIREWPSSVLTPVNMLAHCAPSYPTPLVTCLWFIVTLAP